MPPNLYVHFPFCRRKCSYCALYSRTGIPAAERDAYVRTLAPLAAGCYRTAYFGGGSPALCDLTPILRVVSAEEFTVELHPLDVSDELLKRLREGGVNRISMGVQSLDDAVLGFMGRGYTATQAAGAFEVVRRHFDNAGIDLIVGYPGERANLERDILRLGDWGLRHCSVYALQNERGLAEVPDDETTMNRLAACADVLRSIGLARYEISNYAQPGYECRHNLAVWRGEDYLGVGDGACGRLGFRRTRNFGGRHPETETLTPERDEVERRIFRLRTREGLDAAGHPEWEVPLSGFVAGGLLVRNGSVYCLTPRGMEVCDTILAELVM